MQRRLATAGFRPKQTYAERVSFRCMVLQSGVWVIFSVLAILNLHLHNKALLEMITELARRVAISETMSHLDRDEDSRPD